MARRTTQNGNREWLEVVDDANAPLAVMPRDEVHSRALPHRSVFVLLYNKEHKLYLQQRQKTKERHPGCWDLSATGHVLAGEAKLDAARRELYEELRVEVGKLYKVFELPGTQNTGYEFITLFQTGPCRGIPDPNPEEVASGMFLERHEIAYMVQNFRHLSTPALLTFWHKGLLFSGVSSW